MVGAATLFLAPHAMKPVKPTKPPLQITTERFNNARTGATLVETVLTPATVTADGFGKLFTRKVDGYIYAQPLYLEHAPVGRGAYRNVVYVATQHNRV